MDDEHSDPDALDARARLRALPSVDEVLRRPQHGAHVARHGRAAVLDAARAALDSARAAIRAGGAPPDVDGEIARLLDEASRARLLPVVNATGVVLHTNLGRAPLAEQALASALEVARGYSNLEYDLLRGERGSRHAHAVDLLRDMLDVEDALVVNNNAGAVLLASTALAAGREVVVSRGELVEIGGGFRIPDVLAQSGATLVEVGTTNRTHPRDYEQAIGERTAALLKVHRSNFAIVGFTSEVDVEALARIARARGVPLLVDAGAGALAPLPGVGRDEDVRGLLRRGADLVCFSGDKLLGGPQAGVIVGRAALVEQLRRHPLARALRADKLCLAALSTTLRLWRDDPDAIPVARMLRAPVAALEERARAVRESAVSRGAPAARVEVAATRARVGGGASPQAEIESRAVRVACEDADELAARFRRGRPPVVARIEDGALLFDLRAVAPEDDAGLADALARELGGGGG